MLDLHRPMPMHPQQQLKHVALPQQMLFLQAPLLPIDEHTPTLLQQQLGNYLLLHENQTALDRDDVCVSNDDDGDYHHHYHHCQSNQHLLPFSSTPLPPLQEEKPKQAVQSAPPETCVQTEVNTTLLCHPPLPVY